MRRTFLVLALALPLAAAACASSDSGATDTAPSSEEGAVDEAATAEGEYVEVEVGVAHGFTSDVELKRSALGEALSALDGAEEQHLAPIRDALAELEGELGRLEEAGKTDTTDLSQLQTQLGNVEAQVAALKTAAPDLDYSEVDAALGELRTAVEYLSNN